MHMKYFQVLADIGRHYSDILRHIDEPKYGHLLLDSWGINPGEKPELIEEKEAIRYLIACQTMVAHGVRVRKPEINIVNRCLNRHLKFLETIHGCHASNVNKHPSPLVRKEYKACRHYLFQFSLPAWYEKLPKEILTLDQLYPDFNVDL